MQADVDQSEGENKDNLNTYFLLAENNLLLFSRWSRGTGRSSRTLVQSSLSKKVGLTVLQYNLAFVWAYLSLLKSLRSLLWSSKVLSEKRVLNAFSALSNCASIPHGKSSFQRYSSLNTSPSI